jgi:uncharacterized membrane protein YjdF
MSRGATTALGATLLVIALGFAAIAMWTSGMEGARAMVGGMWTMAAFSAVGALACLLPGSRPVALRLLGGTVFFVCLGYVVAMLVSGPLWQESRRPSLVSSIVCFSIFGLPAGYLAIAGRYPHWGKHSAAFEGSDADQFGTQ